LAAPRREEREVTRLGGMRIRQGCACSFVPGSHPALSRVIPEASPRFHRTHRAGSVSRGQRVRILHRGTLAMAGKTAYGCRKPELQGNGGNLNQIISWIRLMADYGTWRRERWHFLSFYFACAGLQTPSRAVTVAICRAKLSLDGFSILSWPQRKFLTFRIATLSCCRAEVRGHYARCRRRWRCRKIRWRFS